MGGMRLTFTSVLCVALIMYSMPAFVNAVGDPLVCQEKCYVNAFVLFLFIQA